VRANNQSCVLRIEGGGGAVLTGDIERAAERELLLRAPALLPAGCSDRASPRKRDPSSTPEFVKQVAPRYAIFAAGYRNRFGHPREEVLARYRDAGSELLSHRCRRGDPAALCAGRGSSDGERDPQGATGTSPEPLYNPPSS